jgi:hypothetical protein
MKKETRDAINEKITLMHALAGSVGFKVPDKAIDDVITEGIINDAVLSTAKHPVDETINAALKFHGLESKDGPQPSPESLAKNTPERQKERIQKYQRIYRTERNKVIEAAEEKHHQSMLYSAGLESSKKSWTETSKKSASETGLEL